MIPKSACSYFEYEGEVSSTIASSSSLPKQAVKLNKDKIMSVFASRFFICRWLWGYDFFGFFL